MGDPHGYTCVCGCVRIHIRPSPPGERALRPLREYGHAVGLHAVYPHVELDARFDPVVAWHNPDPEYMSEPVAGAVNVMEPPYFDPDHYRSDSNQHWRHG